MKFQLITLTGIAFCLASGLFAQNEKPAIDNEEHKIVFQLTSNDTLVHKAMVKQLQNILNAAPNSKIEVVCHSSGISFLQTTKTQYASKVKELTVKNIAFLACENTMRDQKIKREELLPECGTVPSGVMEVVKKQEKGWAYIRAGQ